jgi:protein SDA1
MAATAAAAGGTADLLALQSSIKRDPEGYRDEFLLQYRHYKATLELFMLRPAAIGAAAAGDGNGGDGDDADAPNTAIPSSAAGSDAGSSRQLAELATFVAQVSRCFPAETAGFAAEVATLLERQHSALDAALRRSLVQALILLRNRGQLAPTALLPLMFRLFRVEDRQLRELLHKHIVADVRASNSKTRNERLNRQLQSYLYGVLQQGQSGAGAGAGAGGATISTPADEAAAKRALAVLTELWRRGVWRDARCVNVIASAVFHPSGRVMLGALRFFLGEDERAAADEDSDEEEEEEEEGARGGAKGKGGKAGAPQRASDRASAAAQAVQPSKEDVYKAMKKGTVSSKKKKQAKLKRVMTSLRKQARREEEAAAGGRGYAGVGSGGAAARGSGGAFAALHLLHDPQGFAERLFARLQACRERWEIRLAAVAVLSRAVGAHKLVLPNLYPWLMRYAQPHARDGAQVLAALAQACHDLVPPETLTPVLRGLADNFVSDRSRPEAMVAGLRAVREVCLRQPLAMTPELLADLAEYRRHRGDREVGTAARALVALFREVNPGLLAKKDRGRAAALEALELKAMAAAEGGAGGKAKDFLRAPAAYGSQAVAARVAGADLLQAALERGGGGSDDEGFDEDDDDYGLDLDSTSSGELLEELMEREREAGRGVGGGGGGESGSADEEQESGSGSELDDEDEDASGSEDGSGELVEDEEEDEDDEGSSGSGSEEEDDDQAAAADPDAVERAAEAAAAPARAPQPGSLAELRRQLAAAAAAKKDEAGGDRKRPADADAENAADDAAADDADDDDADKNLPIEATRILTPEDFARIRALRKRQLVEAALARHGLAPGGMHAAGAGDAGNNRRQLQASRAKRRRLLEAAHAEADEALALEEARRRAGERRIDPSSLEGRVKRRKDKRERLESVLAGREGRGEFGSRASRKKDKTGGLSERQKQKKKALPLAARAAQLQRRRTDNRKRKSAKNFKGHVRGN